MNIPAKRTIAVLSVAFFVFLAIPTSFAADEVKAGTSSNASTANRGSLVQDIFTSQSAKVEVVADSLEYQKDAGKLIARGNAVITYQGTRILSDYAEVETDAKKAYAKGHVMIFKRDSPCLQGEEVFYDFGNHTGSFPNALAINKPWFARGEEIQQVREGVDKIQNGAVTTCNHEKPHYEIRCKKATLYTNEKLILQSATIYILGKPVFWLPWMDIPLNWPNIPFQVQAGYTTRYGAFLELTKGITLNKHLWGKAHVDWRSKRGFGAGWDQYYDFGKLAQGSIKLYLSQDKRAPTPGYVDPVSGGLNPYASLQDRMRGRITWRHRTDINEDTHILLRYNRMSDEYFLHDFFQREYDTSMTPQSFVTGTHNSEQYGTMIHRAPTWSGAITGIQ